MGAIASQITSLTIVYSIVYSDADQTKHQSSASLAFVWGIHRAFGNIPNYNQGEINAYHMRSIVDRRIFPPSKFDGFPQSAPKTCRFIIWFYQTNIHTNFPSRYDFVTSGGVLGSILEFN